MAKENSVQNPGLEENQAKKRLDRDALTALTRVWRFMYPYRNWFFVGMLFLVLSTVTTLTIPMFAGDLINAANGDTTLIPGDIRTIGVYFIVILLSQAAFSFLRIYCFAEVSERAMADIRTNLYDKMITLSVPFFEQRRVGELTSRISSDVTQLQELVSIALAELFRQLATLILGFGFLLYLSPRLTGVMLAVVPVMAILAIFFGRFIRRLSRKRQDALAEANVVVEETLQNIHTVKSFTNESWESNRYSGMQKAVVNIALKAARFRGFFVSFIILAFMGGLGIVMYYGATLLMSGAMDTGDLLTFILYTIFIGGSISGMADLYGRILKSVGASDRIFDMLGEDGEADLSREIEDLGLQGKIDFEGVDFFYPTRPDVRVLFNFSLSISAGEKIALAGSSGAGKSTIAQLLLGFYCIQKGSIQVDGRNIETLSRRALRKQIAIVPQEVILFGGTIRENIAYGRAEATDEEIISAAQKANAWNFIKRFPEGLNTVVGERGVKLSGGQRQRVAIARAILKDPAILILDEATSSLDAESEHLVQEALEELMKNRTTILIAHRLSTIRTVDRIYVLDQGSIAETGSYDELAGKSGGIFHNLLKLQFEDHGVPG